jgi:ATP-binding cassette, subfamily B, bacterial MsbA
MKNVVKSFWRIWPFLRPYKGKIFLFFISSSVLAACGGIAGKLIILLTTDVFEKRDPVVSAWIPFAFPALYLVWGIARYLNSSTANITAETVTARIRQALLAKLVRSNLTFHNSFPGGSGGLISRVMSDTVLLQVGLGYFGDLLREPIMALVYLSLMLWTDWRLTLATLVFTPIFAICLRMITRSLKKYGHQNREVLEGLTSTLKESLDGVRVIQSFNLEKEMDRRFAAQVDDYLHTRSIIIRREETVSPTSEFLASLLVMGFCLYAVHEIFLNRATGGEFIAFISVAGLLQVPLKRLQETASRIQQVIVVIERLFGLLEAENSVPKSANPQPFPQSWQKIEFRNVSFRYGTEMVLKSINLVVKRGEVIALVGTSGSGKSTLVNLLERFFEPTEGLILIDGVSIAEIDLTALRKNIALVTQDVFLFRDSIENNILSGNPMAGPEKVRQATDQANASKFISSTEKGLQTQVGERGGLLSGGEKQRISIARAIMKDAPILILDEATSALDSVSEMEVQKALQKLMEGRTAFVIAHRLQTVYTATRILVMSRGEIVEDGTHQSLLAKKGEYYSFYQLQSGSL